MQKTPETSIDNWKPQPAKAICIVAILASGIISWLLANHNVDYTGMELGALANYYFPPIMGVATFITYLLAVYFSKKSNVGLAITFIVVNILLGWSLRP